MQPGTIVSHYRILARLGEGGMGVVYKAEDLTLGRPVALKFLTPDADGNGVARFEGEARHLSAASHPNICTIYEIGTHEGQPFLAMELLDGDPLHHFIDGGPAPLDLILEVGISVADALEAAHQAGLVHRDVKPANIFITSRGQVKVFDFGLAKPMLEEPGGEAALPALTQTGLTMGTVSYMSPEQARGERLDGRSDVFSLGLVLHEMATGQQTYGGATAAVVFDALLNRPPAPIGPVNPSLPAALQEIITRALEKDRDGRYQRAADLRDALEALRRDLHPGRSAAESRRTVLSTVAEAVTPQSRKLLAVEAAREPELMAAVRPAAPAPSPLPFRRRAVFRWTAAGVLVAASAVGVAFWQAGEKQEPARQPAPGSGPSRAGAPRDLPAQAKEAARAARPAAEKSAPEAAPAAAPPAPRPAGRAGGDASGASDGKADLAVIAAKIDHKLYDEAIADATTFLAEHPSSPLVPEAAFMSAEARRLAGYSEAARGAYVEFGTRYPGSPRVPEALFRLAELTAAARTPTSEEDARRLYGEVASRFAFNARWAAPALLEKAGIEERLKVRQIDRTLQTSVPSALVSLRTLTNRFPTSPQAEAAWWRLADLYQSINRHVHAAEACAHLASNFPDTRYDAWFRAGEIYEKKVKDKERAQAAYAKVPTTSEHYREARRKLNRR